MVKEMALEKTFGQTEKYAKEYGMKIYLMVKEF